MMNEIIKWLNENNGFISALTNIGLLIFAVAAWYIAVITNKWNKVNTFNENFAYDKFMQIYAPFTNALHEKEINISYGNEIDEKDKHMILSNHELVMKLTHFLNYIDGLCSAIEHKTVDEKIVKYNYFFIITGTFMTYQKIIKKMNEDCKQYKNCPFEYLQKYAIKWMKENGVSK